VQYNHGWWLSALAATSLITTSGLNLHVNHRRWAPELAEVFPWSTGV
jgi:hypothetical protein